MRDFRGAFVKGEEVLGRRLLVERKQRRQRTEDHALAEIVQRLIDVYQPDRIYLFGSEARNDSGTDSDYDLMVVVPDSVSSERKRSWLVYQVLRGTGIAADVLVWTKGVFDCRLHLRASLPHTIVSEGRLLYAA